MAVADPAMFDYKIMLLAEVWVLEARNCIKGVVLWACSSNPADRIGLNLVGRARLTLSTH